ncbi:MAG: deaminase [Betaproteobacteria bacterium]
MIVSDLIRQVTRRQALVRVLSLFAGLVTARLGFAQTDAILQRRWYEAAESMKRLAESWGDQSYGAVLVLDKAVVGEGPSRVVKLGDSNAHAEREAIKDAQRRLNRKMLAGAVLYSTSRPCRLCEAAAAEAGVARMYYGSSLRDAGSPRR